MGVWKTKSARMGLDGLGWVMMGHDGSGLVVRDDDTLRRIQPRISDGRLTTPRSGTGVGDGVAKMDRNVECFGTGPAKRFLGGPIWYLAGSQELSKGLD